MKTLSAGLLAHYAQPVTQLCYCLKLTREDGVVHAFTSADEDVVSDGVTYTKSPGVDVSTLAMTANLGIDNLETKVLPDPQTFEEVDLLAGRIDFAHFMIFECDYTDPAAGVNVLRRGWTGETSVTRGVYTIEFRSLKQSLVVPITDVTTKTCRYRLGSTSWATGGLCFIDLSGGGSPTGSPATQQWTNVYQITAIDPTFPRKVFTCADALEVDDFYAEGSATSEDGENEDYRQKIKSFAAGVFTLMLDMPFDLFVGDTVTVVAGCRKRRGEDCRDKFDNVLNFGGEPDMPGPDLLTGDPVIDVG